MNQGCYLVGTEVKLNRLGLLRFEKPEIYTVIDACGVGLKHFSHAKRKIKKETLRGFQLENPHKFEYGYNVLRGIEVKVSRSDFKKGFVCSGCNYHYVLTPMRLVASYEVPQGIGLIEFNKYKFSCELKDDDFGSYEKRPYILKGVRVVKRPVFKEIPQSQIDNVISIIAERFSKQDREKIIEEIS